MNAERKEPRARRRASHFDVVTRGYVRRGRGVVRFLTWSNYEPCDHGDLPREFIFRLRADDPRPRGIHLTGAEWCFDWWASLPVGQWAEIAWPAQEAA